MDNLEQTNCWHEHGSHMSCDDDTDNEPPTFGHHFITYRVSEEFIQLSAAFYNWLFVPGKIFGTVQYLQISSVKGLEVHHKKEWWGPTVKVSWEMES